MIDLFTRPAPALKPYQTTSNSLDSGPVAGVFCLEKRKGKLSLFGFDLLAPPRLALGI
jgi:hypothetical protein